MIVYCVKRRWFPMKADAEKYRVSQGLSRDATLKISITDRAELAALLDVLCVPPTADGPLPENFPAPAQVIDEAFVDPLANVPDFIPKFLLKDHEARLRRAKRGDD